MRLIAAVVRVLGVVAARLAAASLMATIWWVVASTYLSAPGLHLADDPAAVAALLIVGVVSVGIGLCTPWRRPPAAGGAR